MELNLPGGCHEIAIVMTAPITLPLFAAFITSSLTFEYAARHIPVVHLLNVRGLAEENGLPFDPVPLTRPGETDVYYTMRYSPVYAIFALALTAICLKCGRKQKKGEQT